MGSEMCIRDRCLVTLKQLFKAQDQAVVVLNQTIDKYRGAVLQGEEGVGKTLVAKSVAQNKGKTLWVAPAGSLKDIKEKLDEYTAEFNIKADIELISYHGFANQEKLPTSKLGKYDFMIFDESHNLRNWSASWTKRFNRIKSGKFLFLSGTPMVKSPKDYIYVLRKCGLWKGLTTKQLYVKYFDAQPSNFGDFMEFGEFQNKASFESNVDLVTYKLSHKDIDKEMMDFKIDFKMIEGEYKKAKNIKEETKTRLENGLEKTKHVAPLIREHRRENDVSISLVLCHFHETAKALHKELGGTLALTADKVRKEFKNLAQNGGHLITTTGLTSCSLDLNECNNVYMVESTYSFANDRQSINRCRRIGKSGQVNVVYYMFDAEAPVIRSFQRKDMMPSDQAHSKLGPSSLARLEKCPGSYWLPDTLEKADYVAYAAHRGTVAHGILERYMASDEPICDTLDSKVKFAIRTLKKDRDNLPYSATWGCEVKVMQTTCMRICGVLLTIIATIQK